VERSEHSNETVTGTVCHPAEFATGVRTAEIRGGASSISYAALIIALDAHPLWNARACRTPEADIVIGPVYNNELSSGDEPFVV
jgi:hypothetical protein